MASKWRMELEGWLRTIDVAGSVLDVGGAQRPVKGRTKSWDVDDYIVMDVNHEPDEYRDISGSVTSWSTEPMITIVEEARPMKTYENVFCLETIMYTVNPVTAISNLCLFTERNLYISNPLEGYPETKPKGTDMHRLFPNWWKYWLTELGMKIEYMRVVAPMMSNNQFAEAVSREGYKVSRPHASGILIHATKT